MFNKNNPLCDELCGGLGLMRSDQQNEVLGFKLRTV